MINYTNMETWKVKFKIHQWLLCNRTHAKCSWACCISSSRGTIPISSAWPWEMCAHERQWLLDLSENKLPSKSSACSYHPFSLRSRMTQILRHLETFSTSALPASPASPLSVAGGVPKSWASWHSESWVESTVSESLRHQINSGTMWNWAAWEGSSNYYVESDESVHFPPAEPLWLQELKLWDSWTSTSADGTRNTPNSAEMWDLVEERRSREATLFQMSSSRVRSPLRSLA